MVTALGTRLGTRLGTTVGSLTDVPYVPTFDATKMYAISGYTAANYYATQATGGEAGVVPFGIAMLVRMTSLPVAANMLAHKSTTAYAGWQMYVGSTAVMNFYTALSGGGLANSPSRTWTSTEINRVSLVIGIKDTTVDRLWVDRKEIGTGAAAASYQAAAVAQMLGMSYSAAPASAFQILGELSFQGMPTTAQLEAFYDAARTLGDIPTTIGGATVTHRWSVKSTLAAANVAVSEAQNAPATLPDTVTAAAADANTRVGAGALPVRILDPATPKLFSYETTPVFRGADTLTSANYFVSVDDDASNALGWWFAWLGYLPTLTQATAIIAGAASGSTGWDLRPSANSATLAWFMGDGTAYTTSGTAVVTLDRINLIVGVWDQANLKQRTYAKRLEVSTGVTRTAYAPPPAGTKIGLGRSPRDPASAVGTRTHLGFAQGTGTPTLANVQALFDAVATNESMQAMPGVTTTSLIDLTADVAGGGGALPATLTNRAGGNGFTRTGSPVLSNIYSRGFAW